MLPSLTVFLVTIWEIILIDLVLSGDNALVIAAAACMIPPDQRPMAIGLGGAGAILLRILFTTSATFLLYIPYLQAIGGALILLIAVRLLLEQKEAITQTVWKISSLFRKRRQTIEQLHTSRPLAQEDSSDEPQEPMDALPALARRLSSRTSILSSKLSPQAGRLVTTIATITIADLTMSLDNIVAVGAIAKGNVFILALGLLLSISILLIGSALVADLMRRIPGLIMVASFVLAWVSADLIWNDLHKFAILNNTLYHVLLYSINFSVIFIAILFIGQRNKMNVNIVN